MSNKVPHDWGTTGITGCCTKCFIHKHKVDNGEVSRRCSLRGWKYFAGHKWFMSGYFFSQDATCMLELSSGQTKYDPELDIVEDKEEPGAIAVTATSYVAPEKRPGLVREEIDWEAHRAFLRENP